jgi:SAM-dependent methyltransferase
MSDAAMPRFGAHAERYSKFRPAYPVELFDKVCALIGAPRAHAIDLGAGSGQATGDLLARFDHVTAVEPDADMAALIPPHERLTVQVARAEDADFPPGAADAVFAATSFHWMDRPLVSRLAARWLRPGGAFCVVGYGAVSVTAPEAAKAVHQKHDALWDKFRHARLRDRDNHAEILKESGAFRHVDGDDVDWIPAWPVARAAGFYMTASYGAAHARATGDEAGYIAAFEQELREAANGEALTLRFSLSIAIGIV